MDEIINLSRRVLPNHWDQITFELIPKEEDKDVFELQNYNSRIVIRGNNSVSMALGLGWYLKYTAKCNISWCGTRIELPDMLPFPSEPYKRIIEQKYRSYMNYCTFNYSASWWGWERWEKEIDFMALNGINLPLSTVGVEGVWYELLLRNNYSDEEARAFLSGPAFLAWQWMTNIEGFCGPLPKNWIEKHVKLGRRIINRQLELGMTPILQGFSGFCPRNLNKKFPDAPMQLKEPWCGIEGTAQLDPTSPLFQTLGRQFLEIQRDLFGSSGYFAVDPFHESTPPENTKEYMNKVGLAVKTLLHDFDADSIWVAQSWSVRKDIVSVMDKSKLLILDIAGAGHEETNAKRFDNFWGYPFVTGNLHNFGGRTNLHGDIEMLAENQFSKVRQTALNVCGTGLFMEAIGQNPVYYDLAFEMLTKSDNVQIRDWLREYGLRRYGSDSPLVSQSWDILLKTAYARGTNGIEKSSILCARPAVTCKKSGPNDGFHVPYGNRRLFEAAELLFNADCNSEGYCYDLVDIMRQVLSNYGQKLYSQVSEHYKNREEMEFRKSFDAFLCLLSDVDKLLSTREEFSFSNWIQSARSWGESKEEQDFLEHNATVLLTIWGPEENPEIFDYGWKEWSGLINQYYLPRWEKFYQMLSDCLKNNNDYIEDNLQLVYGRETFKANGFYKKLAEWECSWIRCTKSFEECKTDEREIVSKLMQKYKQKIMA